jgi:transcription initiation factor TFIID TATA-box-binding protein
MAKNLEELKKGLDIRVVNIVVSSSLDHSIPLEKMAATLSNTEYNPEQFPGLVIRIKEPKTSALIFSSGNIVCTGAKSLEEVRGSINKIKETLKKLNITITIEPEIHIQNMVASGNIQMDLNLNTLAMKLDNTEYEPEQFPGLIYKLGGKSGAEKATFLIFSNGKIVCTGTKSEAEVYEAVHMLIDILKKTK